MSIMEEKKGKNHTMCVLQHILFFKKKTNFIWKFKLIFLCNKCRTPFKQYKTSPFILSLSLSQPSNVTLYLKIRKVHVLKSHKHKNNIYHLNLNQNPHKNSVSSYNVSLLVYMAISVLFFQLFNICYIHVTAALIIILGNKCIELAADLNPYTNHSETGASITCAIKFTA